MPNRAPKAAEPRLRLSVQLGDRVAALPLARARLRRLVSAAIDDDAELTLRFVGRLEGRILNTAYRERPYATNVLTFVYEPGVADIVLCLPVIRQEAREQRKPFEHHLAHLTIHGVLHAQGYDHEEAPDAARMEAREKELLRRFRIPDPYREI